MREMPIRDTTRTVQKVARLSDHRVELDDVL